MALGVALGVAAGVGVGVAAAETVVAEPADAGGVESAACGPDAPPQAETATAIRAQAPKVPSTDVFNFPPIFCLLPATAG